jgi:hypothetical protein
MNLPALAYDSLSGRTVHPAQHYRTRIKWIDVKHDLKALRGYIGTGEWDLPSYFFSLHGHRTFRVWNLRDPWPFLLSSGRFFKNRLKKIFKKVSKKAHTSPALIPFLSDLLSLSGLIFIVDLIFLS